MAVATAGGKIKRLTEKMDDTMTGKWAAGVAEAMMWTLPTLKLGGPMAGLMASNLAGKMVVPMAGKMVATLETTLLYIVTQSNSKLKSQKCIAKYSPHEVSTPLVGQ